MKKIAIASALLASVLLAACQDDRPAPPPTTNLTDESNGVIVETAPYPGDRR
ncbi:MAG: hypothetical protein PGN16_03690 [Sphingomonas phyllosphaerae]|uniref:hypothetical protein n=1 Tax=Sphingomonas phyllosphaerae TaxID=257003 RepID=UPI002FF6ABD1